MPLQYSETFLSVSVTFYSAVLVNVNSVCAADRGNRWRRASFSHAPMHIEIPVLWPMSALFFRNIFLPQCAEDMMIIHPFLYCSRGSNRIKTSSVEEVLYPKWVNALFPSNIVVVISILICLNSGTQFGNGWFVSYGRWLFFLKCWGPSMLQLGLAELRRDGEMWLDRWKIRKCFWKQTWGVFESTTKQESVLRSEGAEDQRLPEPSSLNLSQNSLISSALLLWDVLRGKRNPKTIPCC